MEEEVLFFFKMDERRLRKRRGESWRRRLVWNFGKKSLGGRKEGEGIGCTADAFDASFRKEKGDASIRLGSKKKSPPKLVEYFCLSGNWNVWILR